MKPKSPQKRRDIVPLTDLIPQAEVKGGGGKRVFGAGGLPGVADRPAKPAVKSGKDRK
jgi:hypothetical protein